MAKISITRALVELKRLDARIDRAISSGVFSAVQLGTDNATAKVMNSQKSVEDVKKEINASFQSVDSLIANRSELKAAIVASNAVTTVELAGTRMTVAAAIELKATLLTRKTYLAGVRTQLASAKTLADRANVKMNEEILAATNALLGGQKEVKDTAMVDAIAATQRKQKEASVIQQSFVETRMKELEDVVLNIETELDFVLSESNALTVVEIKD